MKDDLLEPKLTPPPSTSPIVRGAAVALVTVALAGCQPGPIGVSIDSAPPGVDAGVAPDMGHLSPGLPALDAGVDADNP